MTSTERGRKLKLKRRKAKRCLDCGMPIKKYLRCPLCRIMTNNRSKEWRDKNKFHKQATDILSYHTKSKINDLPEDVIRLQIIIQMAKQLLNKEI